MTKSIQLTEPTHKEIMMLKVERGFISANRVIETLLTFWKSNQEVKHEPEVLNTENQAELKQEESI